LTHGTLQRLSDRTRPIVERDGNPSLSFQRGWQEVVEHIEALPDQFQPLDSDLTAIAALSTTTYGRALLALADAAALNAVIGVPGTFTPTLLFGGAAVGMAGTFTGRYTRLGRLVSVDIIIILTAKGSSTGAATIGALPFTAAASPGSTGNIVAFTLAAVTAPNAAVAAGTTSITLRDFTGSTSVAMTDANFNNTSIITLSLIYTAA
jgi:hypothetical protein